MKLTKLVIAIATFATITLSSSAYIATQDVTSAVLVDKAKHYLDLTTNGLHNISVSEAFTIDKSEAAQINFLRCSFARPEFRFSWFCHQMKKDGKMTKNSYVALKDDQQKYFKENVFKSITFEARKLQQLAEQASTLAKIQRSNKNAIEKAKASGVNGEAKAVEHVEQGGRELITADTKAAMDNFSISDVIERFERSNSPSYISDYEFISSRTIANEQSKDYVVDFSRISKSLGLVPEDNHETENVGVGKNERTTNDKIIAGISIVTLLAVIVILIWAIIIEIKKLEQKLLNGDFNKKLEGENHE